MKLYVLRIMRFVSFVSLVMWNVLSSAQPVESSVPQTIATSRTKFVIPFNNTGFPGSESSRAVELLYSKDRGASWYRYSQVPVEKQQFLFEADSEGEFWFAIRKVGNDGGVRTPDPDRPLMIVLVDTSSPVLRIEAAQTVTGEIALRWNLSDGNLVQSFPKVYCSYHSPGAVPDWQSIAIDPKTVISKGNMHEGQLTWLPTPGAMQVEIYCEAKDHSGNKGAQAVTLALSPLAGGSGFEDFSVPNHRNSDFTPRTGTATPLKPPVPRIPLPAITFGDPSIAPEIPAPEDTEEKNVPKPLPLSGDPIPAQPLSKAMSEKQLTEIRPEQIEETVPDLPPLEPITETVPENVFFGPKLGTGLGLEIPPPVVQSEEPKISNQFADADLVDIGDPFYILKSDPLLEIDPIGFDFASANISGKMTSEFSEKPKEPESLLTIPEIPSLTDSFDDPLKDEFSPVEVPDIEIPAPEIDESELLERSEGANSEKGGKIVFVSLEANVALPYIVFEWDSGDRDWIGAKVTILRGSTIEGPWLAIAEDLDNTGKHSWYVSQIDMDPFFIRLETLNDQGTLRTDHTTRPITIDPSMIR